MYVLLKFNYVDEPISTVKHVIQGKINEVSLKIASLAKQEIPSVNSVPPPQKASIPSKSVTSVRLL